MRTGDTSASLPTGRKTRLTIIGMALLVAAVAAIAVYQQERADVRAATASTFRARSDLIEQYISLMRHKVYALERAIENRHAQIARSGARSPLIERIRHFPEYGVWGISGLAAEGGIARLSGSLTGSERLDDPPPPIQTELSAVLALDGQFETLLRHVPELVWVYYTSSNEFIYISPDPPVAAFHFSEVLYTKPFWTRAIPEQNRERRQVITELYDDAYGQGLMISISSPVELGGEFRGVVSLDIGIDRLRELTQVGDAAGESILVDEHDGIVARPGEFELSETYPHEASSDWIKNGPHASWLAETVVRDELTLLHRLPDGELVRAATAASVPLWIVLAAAVGLVLVSVRLNEALGQVRNLMQRDALTDLLNRRGFEAEAEPVRRLAHDEDLRTGLVLFDIDHFKQVNDSHGHEVGDEVLATLARRLTSGVHEYDLVCRWGGEEILVLLVSQDPANFARIAERLRKSVEARPVTQQGVHVTISGGLTEWAADEPLNQAIGRADRCLYAAKAGGRNRVESDLPGGTASVSS